MPPLEWLLQCVAEQHPTQEMLIKVVKSYRQHAKSALVLNAIICSFDQVARCTVCTGYLGVEQLGNTVCTACVPCTLCSVCSAASPAPLTRCAVSGRRCARRVCGVRGVLALLSSSHPLPAPHPSGFTPLLPALTTPATAPRVVR